MKITLLVSACMFILFVHAQNTTNDPANKYAGLITEKGLKEKLTVIASAEMEGRETASPGQKKAAAYIEDFFKKLGLKPGNGNTYQQFYSVYQDEMQSQYLNVNGKTFERDKDYSFSLNTSSNGDGNYDDIILQATGLLMKQIK